MKILIFSDSHGELSNMVKAIKHERPDYVFHLGDHDRDAEALGRKFQTLPIAAVRGNCDGWGSDTPLTRLIPICGLRLFLCHGHTFGVKSGLLRVSYAAREQDADIVLFGHTHEACFEEDPSGLILFNPGACGYAYEPSYGCLTVEDGKPYHLEIKTIRKKW